MKTILQMLQSESDFDAQLRADKALEDLLPGADPDCCERFLTAIDKLIEVKINKAVCELAKEAQEIL